MKRQALSVFGMLSLMVAAAVASGYAQGGEKVVADIPFNFHVGSKTLLAGKYSVSEPSPAAMLIRSDSGSDAAITLTQPARSTTTQDQAKLVFHQYGDDYFLSQVWKPGAGREILKSKLERQIASRMLAKNGSDRQTVYVAAPAQ